MKLAAAQKQTVKFITLGTILSAVIFLVCIFAFVLIAHEVVYEKEDWLDQRIFAFFREHYSDVEIRIFRFLTFFGSITFLLSAYVLLVIYLFIRHRTKDAISVIIISLSSWGILTGLKQLISRPRPLFPFGQILTNYSFPSGHALLSFIFYFTLVYLFTKSNKDKKWKWIFGILVAIFSITIGISRVILRYHYASDVVAGILLGIAYVVLSFWMQNRIQDHINRKKAKGAAL